MLAHEHNVIEVPLILKRLERYETILRRVIPVVISLCKGLEKLGRYQMAHGSISNTFQNLDIPSY